MSNETSCVGCKFLYAQDLGYSNYTVEETEMMCAVNLNPNLPATEPYDWIRDRDNWPKTNTSRCDRYAPGTEVRLDVDGEETVAAQTNDPDVIAAIERCSANGTQP